MPICFHYTPAISLLNHPGVSLLFPARVFDLKPRLVAESRWIWRPRVFVSLEVDRSLRRKCSPLLDAELLSNANALASNEWRAVPDIWKSTAEKYGHQTALVDLYHDPPTELTYKQIKNLGEVVPTVAGDRFLSVLPSWHAYERSAEYFTFTYGIEQVYTNVKKLKEDLKRYQPQYLVAVPLVYEALYSSINKQISSGSAAQKFVALSLIRISLLYMDAKRSYEGKVLTMTKIQQSPVVALFCNLLGRIVATILWPLHILGMKLVYNKIHSAIGISKAGISGGGSLPLHIDKFFEAIGVKLQNGYGLTETSPVVTCRRPDNNVLGTVGHPLNFTEIMIVDLETCRPLPDGSKGLVKLRGPQIMNGYYKNASATGEAVDEDGWFNSGDIGWIVPKHSAGISRQCGGMLVLEGRAKDTIVLSTGENVEPSELEEAVMRSKLIQQIVVFGQDQRRLGALVVPNMHEVLAAAKNLLLVNDENPELSKEKMLNLLHGEVRNWTKDCSFYIGPIMILDEPFTVENGLLTPTMKVKRDKVIDLYSVEISNLYR